MDYVFHFGDVLRYAPLLVEGALNTLLFSVAGMLAGTAIGLLAATGRRARSPVPRLLATAYVELIRNTPLLVQLFVLFFALPSTGLRLTGAQAAVLGLVLNNGAYMTEIIRAGLDSIGRGQVEAATSLGLSRGRVFRHVVLPQAVERIYPAMTSQFVMLMLSSSIISAIGAEELTSFGARIQSQTFRALEVYLICAAIYLAMTYGLRTVFGLIAMLAFPGQRARA